MRKVLLTGASGFVGSSLLAQLARQPLDILAVSRREPLVTAGARARIAWRRADLAHGGEEHDLVRGCDTIIHLAGSTARAVTDADVAHDRLINLEATERLMAAAADHGLCPAFLFAGSESQHDPRASGPLTDWTPDAPETPYDRHKCLAETRLFAVDVSGKVRGASLRLPTLYGPGPTVAPGRGVVAAMMRRALVGLPIEIYGDGLLLRDFLHVEDVAAGFLAAVTHVERLRGRHWLLSGGASHSIAALAGTIRLAMTDLGRALPAVAHVEPPIALDAADIRSVRIDDAAFRATTGWAPRRRLEDGVATMLASMGAGGFSGIAA